MTAATTRSSATLLVTALCVGLFAGCDDGGVTTDGRVDEATLMGDLYAVIDADDALVKIDDATTDSPMAMRPVFGDGPFVRDPRHPRGHGSHLGHILRDLDVSEMQLAAIRDLLMDFRETIRPLLEGLREVNREIVAAANAERDAIVTALRNGEIGLMEAIRRLRELSEATRNAIRDNPANEPFRAELCAARRELFAAIREVLDADQRAMWDAWVAGLPSGICAT